MHAGMVHAHIPEQRQVELAQGHAFAQFIAAGHAGLDAHMRVGPRELPQHMGQHAFAQVFLQAQAHQAAQLAAAHGRHGAVVELQQAQRVAAQGFPRLRQHQPPAGLAQQGRAALGLQLLELGTDGRCGAAQPVRRPGKAAQFDAGAKSAQHIQVIENACHCQAPDRAEKMDCRYEIM